MSQGSAGHRGRRVAPIIAVSTRGLGKGGHIESCSIEWGIKEGEVR
jgi:hypothetical protein